jgi:hypothetical protein
MGSSSPYSLTDGVPHLFHDKTHTRPLGYELKVKSWWILAPGIRTPLISKPDMESKYPIIAAREVKLCFRYVRIQRIKSERKRIFGFRNACDYGSLGLLRGRLEFFMWITT